VGNVSVKVGIVTFKGNNLNLRYAPFKFYIATPPAFAGSRLSRIEVFLLCLTFQTQHL